MNLNHTVVLFNVPLVLQQEVLGSWLTIKDVAKMDSAVCSRENRPLFLDLLSNKKFVVKMPIISKGIIISWMAWIVARNVRVSQCILCKAVSNALYIPFFIHTGKRLNKITINCNGEDEIAFSNMLSYAAAWCTNIKEITLTNCSSVRGLENILLTSQKSIRNLRILESNLTGFEVGDLTLSSLQFLQLRSCTNITSTTLKQLLQAAHNLKRLKVFQFNDWPSEVKLSRYLRVIAIDIPNITDPMFCSLVHSCPLLEVVMFISCPLLTDVSIIELVQHAKHFNALYLWGNRNFSDVALEAIGVHCGERLRHLCIFSCNRVTATGLNHLRSACHGLHGLYIGGFYMDQITTTALQALLHSNPLLQEVSLEGIKDADAMLMTLAESCPQLHYLDFYNLKGYTNIGISAISRSCTQLRTVVVDPDCRVINPLSRYFWKDHYCPGLKFAFQISWLPFWTKVV